MKSYNMVVKIMSLVALMCSSVFCFHYNKDCVAKNYWETDGIQSSWNIRFWVPKGDSDIILSLLSDNSQLSSARKIHITRSQVHYWSVEKYLEIDNSTSIAKDVMSPGWKEVWVTSGERFRVWVKGMDVPLVDVEDRVQTENITIFGSNVTVNCKESIAVWVGSNDAAISVPIDIPGQFDVTMFSRTPFVPFIRFRRQSKLFRWDPEARRVISFSDSVSTALPPFIQHNFTVQCVSDMDRFICTFVDGPNTLLVSVVQEETEYFSLQSSDPVKFVIILRHKNEDELLVDVKMNDALEERVADSNDCYLERFILLVIIIIALLVFGNVLYLQYIKKKEINWRSNARVLNEEEESNMVLMPIVRYWRSEVQKRKRNQRTEMQNTSNEDNGKNT